MIPAFFVDILLPLPLANGAFTYRVPQPLEHTLAVGKRVIVPFSTQKNYTGVIVRIHHEAPDVFSVKYIHDVLDEKPIVGTAQLQFWQWMSDYYLCHTGEVMNAALPAAFKLTSESTIVLNPDFDGDVSNLDEREYRVVQALQHKPSLTISEISTITGLAKTIPLIKNLRDKYVILVKEELIERYKPRFQSMVRINEQYSSDEALKSLFDRLEKRAFKQLKVLMQYVHLRSLQQTDTVKRQDLLNGMDDGTVAVLRTMIKNGLFDLVEKPESRL
jgi:primosomal protein N' (replication factor Y)